MQTDPSITGAIARAIDSTTLVSLFTLLGSIVAGGYAIAMLWLNRKIALETKAIAIETHSLANSSQGKLKLSVAISARALARITNSVGDIAAAEQTEKEYQEHEASQKRSDAARTAGDTKLLNVALPPTNGQAVASKPPDKEPHVEESNIEGKKVIIKGKLHEEK